MKNTIYIPVDIRGNENLPKEGEKVLLLFQDENKPFTPDKPIYGYYQEKRKCMLSDVAIGAGECGSGFVDEDGLPLDDDASHYLRQTTIEEFIAEIMPLSKYKKIFFEFTDKTAYFPTPDEQYKLLLFHLKLKT